MLKGFKEFLMRGNVVDLAVAVVVGTAFVALVTSFTENFINPLIAAFGGGNVNGLAWQIVDGNGKTVMDFGAMITAVINFVLIAAVVYFLIVLPLKHLQDRRRAKLGIQDEVEPTDTELLAEIRDLLRQQADTR